MFRKPITLSLAALALGIAALIAPVSAGAQTPGAIAFSFAGADQTYVVPGGVTSLTVKLWGAGGADIGGSAAFVTGRLTVIPGSTLTLIVGGGGVVFGSNAYGGGGGGSICGGGRSAIRLLSSSADLVTAGGGGGLNGGFGGLDAGGQGTGTVGAGGGGTQTGGGDGQGGGSGKQYQGGDASGGFGFGGGGGGGYFGGGAGANSGGGGSSYTSNAAFFNVASASSAGLTNTNLTSAGVAPGGANDPDYVMGVGRGGGDGRNGNSSTGGNGEIVITPLVAVTIPEAGTLALLVPALSIVAGAVIARRRREHNG